VNNITTISDHVLLPHQADWSSPPNISRLWRASVENSLDGDEDRLAVRHGAWLLLKYSVLPYNHIERKRFSVRFKQAMRDGKICVPQWGKGVPIENSAQAGATSIKLTRSNHGFADGQYLLIQSSVAPEFDSWDVLLILSTSGANITFSEALDNSYPRGTRVWPLLFGRPIPEDFQVLNTGRSRYSVSMQFDQRQIYAYSYDNFESYDTGEITGDLDGGEGWDGAWIIASSNAA